MTTAKQIKNLYNEYKEAYEMMLDAYTVEDDEIWDAANEREAGAKIAFINGLVEFTDNAITAKDVTRMLVFKREELDSLIARLAA